ncbi:MAG: aminomethyltransferase [Candidatus Saganbacteria bacterium]|uniref:Aminomethyltransferase n=1 Tax=Candidatus Saganbacteria bacterium TaxID=2575572 RepID=A0A833L253_UNCSA|nr:MAG: aminomethyltransferase [Candidatus Saganbacteria bacterium]
MLKRTALYNEHIKLGAKMVPFAGWEMPVLYAGIVLEHLAVRDNCGVFDIGHMGIIDISGANALPFLQYLATNDASLLAENECQYSILCNEAGGVIDDILVYRLKGFFRLVVNASNTEKVLAHFASHQKERANVVHRKDISMISLQGHGAKEAFPGLPVSLPHNHTVEWKGIVVSRTGYTGEDGFEFFVENEKAASLWKEILEKNIPPCGLGARDTLRLEAGLPLYGHEYNNEISPIAAGYSWAVKFNKPDFIGKAALLKLKESGAPYKLVGLKLKDRNIPREHFNVLSGGANIGWVTSGTFSPVLKMPVALAYIKPQFAQLQTEVEIEIRGQKYSAVVTSKKLL